MIEKNFADDFQRAYWELFKCSGGIQFMQLFMEAEKLRKSKNKKMELNLER